MANRTPGKPLELRIGRIKAAIWENETEKGTRHNVTFRRIFHDGKEWRTSDSFGRDDLLVLAKLADVAHTRVLSLQEERDAE